MQSNDTATSKPRFSCRFKASCTANLTIWARYYLVHTIIALLVIAAVIVAIVLFTNQGQVEKPTLYNGLIANSKTASTAANQVNLDNGLTLKGDKDNFTADFGNGLSLGFKDSLVTIKGFGSTIVSSRIVSYGPTASGLQITMENGVSLTINGFSTKKVSDFDYLIQFTGATRTLTTYQGKPISEAGLKLFTIDKKGNATIELTDGTMAIIGADKKITVKTIF